MTQQTNSTNQATMHAQKPYSIGSVISRDGTSIGYRQYGHGPGLVLVQGAMGSAHNFSTLAEMLAETFTVYVPDRRGRGLSPLPYHQDYIIQRDIEDLEALLLKTGTSYVFGLSSGAIITLTAAINSTVIRKLAIFEPPLFEKHPLPSADLARFDRAMAEGNMAAAFAAAGKAVQITPILNYIPNWLLILLSKRMLASDGQQSAGDELTLKECIAALPYDFRIVAETHAAHRRWSAIQIEVLLLGGGKSPAYLKSDLDTLESVLPHARRVNFRELGHAAAWNYDKQRNPDGKPELVAEELRRFFIEV